MDFEAIEILDTAGTDIKLKISNFQLRCFITIGISQELQYGKTKPTERLFKITTRLTPKC